MASYVIGVDVGATFTAASIGRDSRRGVVEPVLLDLGIHSPSMQSVVYYPPTGEPVFGDEADRRAPAEPERVVRDFKARIGDYVPYSVGDQAHAAEAITALTVRHVVDVAAVHEGTPADLVLITHPADWGSFKRSILMSALVAAGVRNARLIAEPIAAGFHGAAQESIEVGQAFAVYDLGGTRFSAAVVRRTGADAFAVLGAPTSIDHLGGTDFDQAVFDHLRAGALLPPLDPTEPEQMSAMLRIRGECREAKESLSSDTVATIPVRLPGVRTRVRLTRSEFEGMVRDALASTVLCLDEAIESAGVAESTLAAILMVGGSSRVPLAAELLSDRFACPLIVDGDPAATVALGAARYGAAVLAQRPIEAADGAAVPAVPGPLEAGPAEVPAQMPADDRGAPTGDVRDRHSRDDDSGDPIDALAAALAVEMPAGDGGGRHRFVTAQRGSRRHRAGLSAAAIAIVVAASSLAFALFAERNGPVPSAIAEEVSVDQTVESPAPGGDSTDAAEDRAPGDSDGTDPAGLAPDGGSNTDQAIAPGAAGANVDSGTPLAVSPTSAAASSTSASTSATASPTSASSTALSVAASSFGAGQQLSAAAGSPAAPATAEGGPTSAATSAPPAGLSEPTGTQAPSQTPPSTVPEPSPSDHQPPAPSEEPPTTQPADPAPSPDPPAGQTDPIPSPDPPAGQTDPAPTGSATAEIAALETAGTESPTTDVTAITPVP